MHELDPSTTTSPRAATRPDRGLRRAVALCAAAAALAVAGGTADASAASEPFLLSDSSVDRLVQSTGNLYWTSHVLNEPGPSSATVYRASKSTFPGLERSLYTEFATDSISFGDLSYALTSEWYGYFVANYPGSSVSRIKRVPLAGGSAITLATSPSFVGMGDIVNDGSYLYWADTQGLRKMAIGGGPVTTLIAGTGLWSIGLDAGRVYYASGASIRHIAKTGGAPVIHLTTGSTVTALDVRPALSGTVIYWGEQNGAVRSLSPAGTIATHQSPVSFRRTRSVSFDGTRVLWTECRHLNGNVCAVRKRQGGITTQVSAGGVSADNVQGDAAAMFFSDPQLKKYVH